MPFLLEEIIRMSGGVTTADKVIITKMGFLRSNTYLGEYAEGGQTTLEVRYNSSTKIFKIQSITSPYGTTTVEKAKRLFETMIAYAIDLAKEQGAKEVETTVFLHPKCYTKFGFIPTHEELSAFDIFPTEAESTKTKAKEDNANAKLCRELFNGRKLDDLSEDERYEFERRSPYPIERFPPCLMAENRMFVNDIVAEVLGISIDEVTLADIEEVRLDPPYFSAKEQLSKEFGETLDTGVPVILKV